MAVQALLDHVERADRPRPRRDHRPRAHRRRAARREIHAAGDYSLRASSSARRSPPAAATCWRSSSSERIPPLRPLEETIERDPRPGRASRSPRTRWRRSPPASAAAASLRPAATTPIRATSSTRSSCMNPQPPAGRGARPRSARSTTRSWAWPRSATPTPTCSSTSAPAGPGSPARPRRTIARPSRSGRRSPDGEVLDAPGTTSSVYGRQLVAKAAPPAAILSVPAESGDDSDHAVQRPRAAERRPCQPTRSPLKIGIVSPYGYPHPGGVNEHVRHTYEAMRRDGPRRLDHHQQVRQGARDARATSFASAPAAPSRPTGSMGRVTLSWRFKERARELLAEQRFDILHFHEPFVPFLSPTDARPVRHREHRHLPRLRRLLAVVLGRRAASPGGSPTSSTAGSRSAGAARHFISRYFPGDYRIIPNGVDLDLFADAEPFEELRDGTINILFVGRFEERKGLIHLLQAYHRLRKRHVDARLLVIGSGAEGARVPPLRRPAPDPRRRVPGPRHRRRRRPATSPAPTSSARRPPGRRASGSCCSRRWPPACRSSPPTSTATRTWSSAACRACWWSRATIAPWRPRSTARQRRGAAAPHGRGGAREGAGVRLGPGHRADRGLLLRDPRPGDRAPGSIARLRAACGRPRPLRCDGEPDRLVHAQRAVSAFSASTPRPARGHARVAQDAQALGHQGAGDARVAATAATHADRVDPAALEPERCVRLAVDPVQHLRRRSRRRPRRRPTGPSRGAGRRASARRLPRSRRSRPSGRGRPRPRSRRSGAGPPRGAGRSSIPSGSGRSGISSRFGRSIS